MMREFNTQNDVSFQVPFTHRLRFTKDLLGPDRDVLVEVLEPSGPQPSRVQVWIDQGLADARPDLHQRIRAIFQEHRSRVKMAGNIQIVPGGETIKNDIHVLERMLKVMHAAELDRRSYVVVFGGGAVLDAVGFAASIAHRGIRLVRLPSSTLSQGDSGVGVKNGVNLFGKKNWIGAFAVPWAVINDERLLETLDERHYRSGFSEAVKVALIKDALLFTRIESSAPAIRKRENQQAIPILKRSAILHLQHITEGGDPFESLEARPLDFGHWSAHRLEAMSDFSITHGEAVSIGLAIDTMYSSLALNLDLHEAHRVLRCLQSLGLPLWSVQLQHPNALLEGLEQFRQHLGGMLTLTMLQGIGKPLEINEIDPEKIKIAIKECRHISSLDGAKKVLKS